MKKDKQIIFHIVDSRYVPIIVQPFDPEDRSLLRSEGELTLEGRYGMEPEADARELIRGELYNIIDTQIKEWLAEKYFIPRFLISAGVFFASFFFLSFVIRDVIPLLDELLFSSAAAAASYVLLVRRAQVSRPALEKKILLKKRIDRIHFIQSEALQVFERIFQRFDGVWSSGSRMPDQRTDPHEGLPGASGDQGEIVELTRQMEQYLESAATRVEFEKLAAQIDISSRRKRQILHDLERNRLNPGKYSREERLFVFTEALLRKLNPELLFPAPRSVPGQLPDPQ
jgi:hypothetical protein